MRLESSITKDVALGATILEQWRERLVRFGVVPMSRHSLTGNTLHAVTPLAPITTDEPFVEAGGGIPACEIDRAIRKFYELDYTPKVICISQDADDYLLDYEEVCGLPCMVSAIPADEIMVIAYYEPSGEYASITIRQG